MIFPKVTTIFKTKKDPKVVDPPRYPHLINPIEDEAKKSYSETLNSVVSDLSKILIKLSDAHKG